MWSSIIGCSTINDNWKQFCPGIMSWTGTIAKITEINLCLLPISYLALSLQPTLIVVSGWCYCSILFNDIALLYIVSLVSDEQFLGFFIVLKDKPAVLSRLVIIKIHIVMCPQSWLPIYQAQCNRPSSSLKLNNFIKQYYFIVLTLFHFK